MPVTVPCGNCIGCRIDKSRQWAIRCVHEAKEHTHNCFLTLTYDDKNLPAYGSLQKADLQRFFKRLRKDGHSFRYFAVGEYGPSTRRPHYHVILFGMDFISDRRRYKSSGSGESLYKSPYLESKWTFGESLIGSFSYQTAAYTARYCMKKVTGERAKESYVFINPLNGEKIPIEHEFSIMSLKPGIGSSWYEKYGSDAFPSDYLVHKGKYHPVPRYYTNKLEKEDIQTFKLIKTKRRLFLQDNSTNNTLDRLAVREEVKTAQLRTLKREI